MLNVSSAPSGTSHSRILETMPSSQPDSHEGDDESASSATNGAKSAQVETVDAKRIVSRRSHIE